VFAVDEGILQVAGYRLADPLDTFFEKRRLEVGTAQVLDLLLPEFGRLQQALAPGGDAEALLAANLNPFQRKRALPAAFWSGIVDVDGERTLQYTPPPGFNGTLKLMAVAVSATQIGIAENRVPVRGDFVLLPNAPTTLAPGDQTEVSVGVSYPPAPGAQPTTIAFSVKPSAGLTVEPANQSIALKPGDEGTLNVRVRAGSGIGAATLDFLASADTRREKQTVGISVRPLVAYESSPRIGAFDGPKQTLGALEKLHNPLAKRELKAGPTPLILGGGLVAYLDDFPHRCTEQILSQALPALIVRARPELGEVIGPQGDRIAAAIEALGARQNSAGGFGLWTATPDAEPFISAYAGLFLSEAKTRGVAVPRDIQTRALSYLDSMSRDPAQSSPEGLRARALAVYVRTREGQRTTEDIAMLKLALENTLGAKWVDDGSAALLAASLKLLKLDAQAEKLLEARMTALNGGQVALFRFTGFYDPLVRDALSLFLVARHFPELSAKLTPNALGAISEPLQNGHYNTLSGALSVLALEAFASAKADAVKVSLSAVDSSGKATAFGEQTGWLTRGRYTDTAVKLELSQSGQGRIWYALKQAGYPLELPKTPIRDGLEVIREFIGDDGKTTSTRVRVGETLEVRVKLRALGQQAYEQIAIVDLLPGGFELEQPDQIPGEDARIGLGLDGSTLAVDHEEPREDRLLLYATATDTISEFRYRIKATNVGRYAIPALDARSMYEHGVRAQLPPTGTIEVVKD
jgi:alpha-2-macroglobulin